MNFDELRKIDNESEQVNETYNIFCEDTRLNHSKSARVEFITTIHYIEKHLVHGMRILDIGAGAGEYSLHFAKQGYSVCALELASRNIDAFRKKITPELNIELIHGNALSLCAYEDESFDIVLLMGPLYHLHSAEDRSACIREAMRVLSPDGTLFVSFINHDMVFMSELRYNPKYFITGDFDPENMRLNDFPFVFHTVPECRKMLCDEGLIINREIASDGASELMSDEIDAMDDTAYNRYFKYHMYRCEKPELLGFSNHLLFECVKKS